MIKIYLSLFLMISIVSCKADEQKKLSVEDKKRNSVQPKSKLDQILGDKVLDFDKDIIRENNFDDLLKLSVDDLLGVSELYEVEKVNDHLYLMLQPKIYTQARNFILILKTTEDSIIDYFCINDEYYVDHTTRNDTIYILTQNDNKNGYWNQGNGVSAYSIDSNANKLWRYRPNNHLVGLTAEKIAHKNTDSFFQVRIHSLGSSTESFIRYRIELNRFGKLLNISFISEQNWYRDHHTQEDLLEIFSN